MVFIMGHKLGFDMISLRIKNVQPAKVVIDLTRLNNGQVFKGYSQLWKVCRPLTWQEWVYYNQYLYIYIYLYVM